MSISDVDLTAPLLTPAGEIDLARRIEAGLYAEHLLASGAAHHDGEALARVRQRGRAAWQRMWLSNLRLVVKFARQAARRHVLPLDDLFQDGCIGLAEAMMRFDHRLGLRFSTLAHEYVRRAVGASAARRCGDLDGPAHRHRVRSLLHGLESETGAAPLRQLARELGVSLSAATTASVRTTGLDHVEAELEVADPGYERVDSFGTDFLALLDEAGELLRRRFGVGCPPATQVELAEELGVSPSTISRLELRALEAARELLDAERCRISA